MSRASTDIYVDVDPATAFKAFTEEYDQWWGNGPIDGYATWRLVENRIEPGVGGRLLEDYGDEQRVLATITIWEPGRCVAWITETKVTTEVTFDPDGKGTRVTVTSRVPEGVDGRADQAMLRMVPQWFPRHIERKRNGRIRQSLGRFGLALQSSTPAATARWLADTFQLECTGDIPDEEGEPEHCWIEFRIGNSMLVLWGGNATPGADTPMVFVDDLDAHLEHARTRGAEIVTPIMEHGYRAYTALDCEGRHWQFAQAGRRLGR